MFMESECIIGTMVYLKHRQIPCLGVHDSIIVPISKARMAAGSLMNSYWGKAHSKPSLKVTAQLLEGTSGSHIWAKRYDRNLEDIFDLQDELPMMFMTRVKL